jgi:uncharacterized protein YegP (UPF0339 family)
LCVVCLFVTIGNIGSATNLQIYDNFMTQKAGKISARSIQAREKQAQAVQLRANGATLQQIADALGYKSRTSAYRAIEADLTRQNSTYRDDAEMVREMMVHRLDEMMLAFYPKARQGDQKAAEVVMRIDQRRSDLLGLDAPKTLEARVQIDITTYNTAIRDFVELYREHYGTDEDAVNFVKQVNEVVNARLQETSRP